jgi:hypothetical protein
LTTVRSTLGYGNACAMVLPEHIEIEFERVMQAVFNV